jgi:hypothetical protein
MGSKNMIETKGNLILQALNSRLNPRKASHNNMRNQIIAAI